MPHSLLNDGHGLGIGARWCDLLLFWCPRNLEVLGQLSRELTLACVATLQ